ncbi:hypothetical protein [Bradyrhizobium genosp. SA-3]|uniref:hypothetical protein n=1 Tax=Bradyrhizobium genosp. SA-3 TaxID=508868 RepID=UPI001FE0D167|nr:hypothetical protein [Bradyrhizobium genosp. SA-3]
MRNPGTSPLSYFLREPRPKWHIGVRLTLSANLGTNFGIPTVCATHSNLCLPFLPRLSIQNREPEMTTVELPAAPSQAAMPARIRLLCILFFFSGFPALIYQLTWQRSLFRIFGVNTESVTIVVTAFMLGLGLGSLAGGWLSKRGSVNPLLLLGIIELATAAFGLVSLGVFDLVGRVTADMSLPAIAIINLLLVLLPTLLMGATLPILVSYLVRMSGEIGSSVGTLYFVNTLGAGAACLISAVLIFPFAGMQGAVMIAAGINIAVGVGASRHTFWAVRRLPPRRSPPSTARRPPFFAWVSSPRWRLPAASSRCPTRSISSAPSPSPRVRARLPSRSRWAAS